MQKLISKILIIALLLPCMAQAQVDPAVYFDAPNLSRQMGSMSIVPFFTGKQDRFWFVASDSTERNYYLVDPATKKKRNLSDKLFLAKELARIRKEKIDTAAIKVTGPGLEFHRGLGIQYNNSRYNYEFATGKLVVDSGKLSYRGDYRIGISPNKKWQLFARAHNLWLRRTADSLEQQLSSDAGVFYSFNVSEEDTARSRESSSEAVWIKGSEAFYVLRKDKRKVGVMTVVHTLSQPRPRAATYKYELPADKDVTQYELYIGNAAKGNFLRVNTERWKDQQLEIVYAGSKVYFLRQKRTRDEVELCAVDTATGAVKVLIHEVSRPFINEDLFKVHILQDGKTILWWSDRSGWGHYYRYDGEGRLQQAVTSGEWTAGKVLRIDTSSNTMYFYGYGREKGINPYYAQVYKAGLSGNDLMLLTPGNATHQVFIGVNGKYMVDTYSRIDLEPRTIVRDMNGNEVMEAWKPDMGRLYRYGWKQPQMFTVKAADGVTDLYGLMWKPFNFDSTKKYPVISQVYPGPQIETVWSEFTVLDRYNNTALAQEGFIVVVMGHRGGSPYRSKAYHTYGYGNLRDYALDDDKAGLGQLARRYPFMDTCRVGIFGHSGGGMMAVAALGKYPEFYKVAVASSGNHDNRIYNRAWGESYQGIDSGFNFKVKTNQELAAAIKGHLLLVAGEVDQNVHPGHTYRMADALIHAGKDFDMLILPGQSHTYEGDYKRYYEFRLRSYFKKYL
ncbi:MAG TPA: DPP IV N-terminal domain-containing protein [Pseudobacter sp.]|nr:DPP IV N-terminal domain-containing protein [Pseudobacter sp.]